ncbi:MAG: thermonuclease family protein [Thomasclavelia sp.]|nr:thermonuclease family protein [Thomasclavelia sp.]
MNKALNKKLSKSFIFVLILFSLFIYSFSLNSNTSKITSYKVQLEKVIDGDSVYFKKGKEKIEVRLIYIDTPEYNEYYGKEAKEFTNTKLKEAKSIILKLNKKGNKYDKYNRLLAWVFVDDKLLQEQLVVNGYVKKFYDYGYSYDYKSNLIKALKIAKHNKVGLYAK